MKPISVDLPLLGLIAGTRGMLGAGIGLLVADRLTPERRRAVGWTLMIAGLLTTVPLAAQGLSGPRDPEKIADGSPAEEVHEDQLADAPA